MTGPIVSRGRPLAELLPAFYRLRDVDPSGDPGMLQALLGLIDREIEAVERELATRYDDLFVETCSDAELGHFEALLGVRQLPGQQARRALIGDIINYRRGKGTIATLEEVAGAASGWSAHAVEYFRLLATTQYLNHLRPRNAIASVRRPTPLQWTGTPFDALPHTVDVRSIETARGRYNIPDVGVHLWRLEAVSTAEASPAVPLDAVRFRFHPLGIDMPLYSSGGVSDGPRAAWVVEPLRLLQVRDDLDIYYGPDAADSLCVYVDGVPVPVANVVVCDLGDAGGGWGHVPAPAGGWGEPADPKRLAIDPTRGRLAFAADPGGAVGVTFWRARPMEIGSRDERDTHRDGTRAVRPVRADGAQGASTTVEAALAALPAEGGIVEIRDNGHYAPAAALAVPEAVTIRAGDRCWPLVDVSATSLDVAAGASLVLDGLLLTGGVVHVTGAPAAVTLAYCSLVPGLELHPGGTPDAPSLVLDLDTDAGTAVHVDHCVSGPIRVAAPDVTLRLADTVLASAGGAGTARHEAVLVGASLAAFPALPAGSAALRLQVGVNAEFDLQLGSSPTTLADAAAAIRAALAALTIDPGSAPSFDVAAMTVDVQDDRLVINAPGTDPIIAVDATATDQTATLLGLTAAAGGHSVWGLLGDLIADPPSLPAPLPAALQVELGPPGLVGTPTGITLATAPASIHDAAVELEDALRAGPDAGALVLVVGDRLRVVPGQEGAAVRFLDGPAARELGLCAPAQVLAASSDGLLPAPPLVADRITVLGDVHVMSADVSDSIVTGTLVAQRRQTGCLRYSYVGAGSQTGRRFHCCGADAGDPSPTFVSTRFGDAGFAQQSPRCPAPIAQGAEDGAEMGAFSSVHQPQRLAAVRSVLAEYLRFTAEGGIFFES